MFNSGNETYTISIVIPVYNVEKYLSDCLESVLKQDLTNCEIILVDDGSIDNSGKICDAYSQIDKRITVIHKSNEGLLNARLTGVEAARGKYILSLDSDDIIFESLLDFIKSVILKYDPEVICFELQEFGLQDKKIRKNIYEEKLYLGMDLQTIRDSFLCNISEPFFTAGLIYGIVTKVVSRSLLYDILKIVPKKISLGEDLAITAYLLNKTNSLYVSHFLGYGYRQVSNSISHHFSSNTIIELKEIVKILKQTNVPNSQIGDFVSFRLIKYISDITSEISVIKSIILFRRIDKEILEYVHKTDCKSIRPLDSFKISLLRSNLSFLLFILYKFININRLKK